MDTLSISLMGSPELRHAGQRLSVPSRKGLLLLGYLLLEPGRHSRENLSGLFWPESEPDVARSALRNVLAQLRRVLPDRLVLDGPLVEFRVHSDDTVDVLGDEPAPSDQPFLLGLEVTEEGELQDWLTAMRDHLQVQQRTRLQRRAQQLERAGQFAEALETSRRRFALDPTVEDATHVLMTLAQQAGDATQLHGVYEQHRHALAQRVDAQPSARIRNLLAELQASVVQAGPGGVREAEVFQFPPLPIRPSSFVGRQEDLAQVQAVIAGGARLVTLQGIGGIGKTRLALAVGAALQSTFPGRVAFVPLETFQTPQALPEAILAALNLSGDSGTTAQGRVIAVMNVQPSVLILDNFEHLMDGAELVDHLLARCPALTVVVTSREALNLQQEHRFPVRGLAQAAVDGLGEDTDPNAPTSDAAHLFLQRARQVGAAFALTETTRAHIEQLCRLLGGAPLALELAASWLRVLSVEELLHDLSLDLDVVTSTARNVPARQQNLRAVFEYSWVRLRPQEQSALAALSVFRDGFTREAAREVAGASIQTLARLVDTSLLQADRDGRFDQHPLISQYTQEKHEATGDAESIRERHARYFTELAAQAFPHLYTVGRVLWLYRLEAEHQNLTLTLDRLRHTGQLQALLGLCADLVLYWRQRGHEVTGRRHLLEAIQTGGSARGTLEYARAQCMLGQTFAAAYQAPKANEMQWLKEGVDGCRRWGEHRTLAFGLRALAMERETLDAEARDLIEEARQISQSLGEASGLVVTENALGIFARRAGDDGEAQRHFERALSIAQSLAEPTITQWPLLNLATLALQRGDYGRAAQLYETGLAVFQQLGQVSAVADTSFDLGAAYHGLGNFEAATTMLRQALRLYRQQGHSDAATTVLMNLAEVLVDMNQLQNAERLLQEAEREAGAGWRWPDWTLTLQGSIHCKRQQPSAAREAFLTVMSRAVEESLLVVRSALEQYLASPHPRAEITDLVGLLRAASVFQTHVLMASSPQSRANFAAAQQQIATHARNELGDAAFEQLVGAARQLSLAEAIEMVRQHAAAHLKTAPPVS